MFSFKKSMSVRRSGNHPETNNDRPIQQVHGWCEQVGSVGNLLWPSLRKWWKRVFFHLVDVSLVNAYLTYCKVTTGRRLTHMEFRLEMAEGLIERSGAVRALPETPGDAMHLPVHLVGWDHYSEPGKTRDCRVCSRRDRKRKQTSFQCCTCRFHYVYIPAFVTSIHTRTTSRISTHAQTPFSSTSFT